MNTPKYYIGQKVMWRTKEYTIMDFVWVANQEMYFYNVDNFTAPQLEETDLTRPPAKLEFGYCAVGDVITDGEYQHEILDVRETIFCISITDDYKVDEWLTYEQAENDGWEVNQSKTQEDQKLKELKQLADEQGYTLVKK